MNSEKKFNISYLTLLRRFHDEQGFSLVELMIVIGIIGILTLVVVPSFSLLVPNYKLKAAARDLYSNFQKAKITAIKTNNDVVISFNVAANSYMIFIDDGGTTGTAGDDTQNGDEFILMNITFPDEVILDSANFSFGSTTPGFTPKGLPLRSRIGNVQLRNTNNRWYRITLSLAGGLRLQIGTDSNSDGVGDSWS
ncbi:MAG: GspH/FimT family pseudopilin [Desulfobulbaceae bacterium]|nr:GspH/FimT family pseudopilin [Desulfobulbaceae bacterium]